MIDKVLSVIKGLFSESDQERARSQFRSWAFFNRVVGRFSQKNSSDYLAMQRKFYDLAAKITQVAPGKLDGDFVVGSWEEHDKWSDFNDYLMKYAPSGGTGFALDFGCGPGRNIRKYSSRFKRVDGVDISAQNLKDAEIFLKNDVPADKWPQLFLTTGSDTGKAPENFYDFVFSTICLQHICVHEVRFKIFESIYRNLKLGGRFSAQMGYGVPSPQTVPYDSNYYQAGGTNAGCDVAVGSPDQIKNDLSKIGFTDFEFWIRPVGPGDDHPNWIFFHSRKTQELILSKLGL